MSNFLQWCVTLSLFLNADRLYSTLRMDKLLSSLVAMKNLFPNVGSPHNHPLLAEYHLVLVRVIRVASNIHKA